eukprot:1519423-Amphidinium_carterae.1
MLLAEHHSEESAQKSYEDSMIGLKDQQETLENTLVTLHEVEYWKLLLTIQAKASSFQAITSTILISGRWARLPRFF